MNQEEIKKRFERITVWRRGGLRAPHKPLLVMYAIGRLLRGEPRLAPFKQIDKDLSILLKEFGPPRKSTHPEYPFWRLKNDGLWELTNTENVQTRRGNTDAKKTDLLRYEVAGGFPDRIQRLLTRDQFLATDIVKNLLNRNFPDTLHDDILSAVGIDLSAIGAVKRIRDPEFRRRVLRAYEYRCAVCGFDVRIGNRTVALEAGHIKWHQAGGPDTEDNGLALCSMHHKLFDSGVFTLSNSMAVIVSEDAHGSMGFDEWVMAFNGKRIKYPLREYYYPDSRFLAWHIKEVFQGPGRINSY
jgi:putative restriction endonuclease